jgi:hypothetical protein
MPLLACWEEELLCRFVISQKLSNERSKLPIENDFSDTGQLHATYWDIEICSGQRYILQCRSIRLCMYGEVRTGRTAVEEDVVAKCRVVNQKVCVISISCLLKGTDKLFKPNDYKQYVRGH